MRNISRFKLLHSLPFFLPPPPPPFSFALPLPFFSFHSLRFCHPWTRIIEEYTPLIVFCHVFIRLIPKFLNSFALPPLSIYFFSSLLIFLLLLPFLLYFSFPSLSPFPSLPFSFFTLLFPSLLFHFSLIFFPGPKIL